MKIETVIALQQAGVDTESALRRFGGSTDLYARFLLKFPADENYAKIGPALEGGDQEGALMAAHTLKGVSANLGMNRLFRVCSQIVDAIRAGRADEAVQSRSELDEAYREICAALALENV